MKHVWIIFRDAPCNESSYFSTKIFFALKLSSHSKKHIYQIWKLNLKPFGCLYKTEVPVV